MEARQPFSRLGWALFAQMAVMLAAQWGVLLLARAARPGLLGEPVFLWAASVWGPAGWGFPPPVWCWQGDGGPAASRPAARWGRCLAAPLGGSVGLWPICPKWGLPLLLTGLLGRLRGAAVVSPVESIGLYPLPLQLLLAGLVAPCWRRNVCSAGCCCAACGPMGSALRWWPPPFASGLFHGNLNQFFYAFLLGLVLAELALSTGCLWQAVLLHALVNLFSILWGRLGGPVVVTRCADAGRAPWCRSG
ncbi:MAG: lysostaphin resistance A-like protein [Flavonifractor plautii]